MEVNASKWPVNAILKIGFSKRDLFSTFEIFLQLLAKNVLQACENGEKGPI